MGVSMAHIGHRGAGGLEPENTLRALRRGMECADFLEVDLRLARDGVVVAIHDATPDRTADGTGPVKDFTIKELKRLDAGEGCSIQRMISGKQHGPAPTGLRPATPVPHGSTCRRPGSAEAGLKIVIQAIQCPGHIQSPVAKPDMGIVILKDRPGDEEDAR